MTNRSLPNRSLTNPRFPGRRALRWFLLCASAALSACSWLEAEFSTLDRLPPRCREVPDAPVAASAERP